MLGVKAETLDRHGAVSRETAMEMAQGALARSDVDLAVSVTGIAGPDGGSEEKPVGLVYFGAASRRGQSVDAEQRYGDIGRAQVRKHSVLQAFRMLHDLAEKEPSNA
jgi:nicotinamide-nucleotide amidase